MKFGDETAYVIIGIAGKNGKHIQILSSVATVCTDLKNIELLKKAKDENQVLDLLSTIKISDE